VAGYLNTLSMLSSSNFVDDQKPLNDMADFTLNIEGNNFASPIVVKAFKADTVNRYLVSSSLNEGAYFSGKSNDLSDKIFAGKNKFFKVQEEVK
jgi:hypothetical protein